MNGKEFIEMQKQDAATHPNKEALLGVISAMEDVLRGNENTEIDDKKSAEECFKKMRDYAKKNQTNGMYYFSTEAAAKFISEYLGISRSNKAPETAELKEEVKPTIRKRRNLEEFF